MPSLVPCDHCGRNVSDEAIVRVGSMHVCPGCVDIAKRVAAAERATKADTKERRRREAQEAQDREWRRQREAQEQRERAAEEQEARREAEADRAAVEREERVRRPAPTGAPSTKADTILFLGLLALVLFPPLGVVAIIMGGLEQGAINAGKVDPNWKVTAGRILGLLAIGVWLIVGALVVYGY